MTTLFTDNFTRANGGVGSNYTTLFNNTALAIVSNTCQGGTQASDGGGVVNSVGFPNDQWAQTTVGAVGLTNEAGMGPLVRASLTTETFYTAFATGPGAGGTFWLLKAVNGSYTTLGSPAGTVATGDVIYLQIIGTTLIVQKNGVQVFTITDASISSGSAGVFYSSQDSVTDTVTAFSAGGFSANSASIAWVS